MVSDDAPVDGLLHEHAQLPQRAVLQGWEPIKFDILNTAVSASPNMRILDEIGVDKSEELAPCQISGIQLAEIFVHPSDWTDIIWFAVQDVVVLVSEWVHD